MRLTTLALLPLIVPVLAATAPDASAADFRGGKLLSDSVNTDKLRKNLKKTFRASQPDDGSDTPAVAFVVSEFTDFSGPAPLENPVTSQLVWEDGAADEQTFSTVVNFEDDPTDQAYTVVMTWYDALGNVLGSAEEVIVAEGKRPAHVSLEVLNPPNAQGDVVLLKGDLVQVNFTVMCDLPWIAEDCQAQQDATSKNDRLQLMTADGGVVDKTKRGRKLSGLVLLKAKTLAADSLVVGYLRKDSFTVTDTSDTPITVVADPATAALIARVSELEARVAELEAGGAAQDEAILANRNRDDDFEDRVDTLSDTQILLDGRVSQNTDTGAANAVAIEAVREPLIQHLMLYADDKISFDGRISGNTDGIAANTVAIEAVREPLIQHLMLYADDKISFDGRITINAGGIAQNTAALEPSDPILFESSIDELDAYVAGQGKLINTNTSGIETNTAAVAALDGEVAKNKAGIAQNTAALEPSDPILFESSIDELDAYIAGQGKAISTNTNGVKDNAADIAATKVQQKVDRTKFEIDITELELQLELADGAIGKNADGVAANAASIAAITDGLGSPQANYAGIIRDQAKRLSGGETTRLTFVHADFALIGEPIGDYEDVDAGYRHLTDVSIVDLTGDGDDSPFEMGITLTGNLPGIAFAAGASIAFPNMTAAPAGAEVDLFGINADGSEQFLGRGTVSERGKFYAQLEGDLHIE